MDESTLINALWPHMQHLNFGEISQVAQQALAAAQTKAFELTKLKIAEAGLKSITEDEAERRDLRYIGEGVNSYHATVWGDAGRKVQIGVKANNPLEAISRALAWGRNSWWKDRRDLGIESLEQVVKA